MRNKLLCVHSGIGSCTNASLGNKKTDQSSYKQDSETLCSEKEALNQNAAKWTNKQRISLETDMPTIGTGKRIVLAWHYNIQDLILEVSCSSEA